jgi:hypothetical protein
MEQNKTSDKRSNNTILAHNGNRTRPTAMKNENPLLANIHDKPISGLYRVTEIVLNFPPPPRFATFVLFKAQDFNWPKMYFMKFQKRAFLDFFLNFAVFCCSFWVLAVFVVSTIMLDYFSSA